MRVQRNLVVFVLLNKSLFSLFPGLLSTIVWLLLLSNRAFGSCRKKGLIRSEPIDSVEYLFWRLFLDGRSVIYGSLNLYSQRSCLINHIFLFEFSICRLNIHSLILACSAILLTVYCWRDHIVLSTLGCPCLAFFLIFELRIRCCLLDFVNIDHFLLGNPFLLYLSVHGWNWPFSVAVLFFGLSIFYRSIFERRVVVFAVERS